MVMAGFESTKAGEIMDLEEDEVDDEGDFVAGRGDITRCIVG